jgi:hypothetical protein
MDHRTREVNLRYQCLEMQHGQTKQKTELKWRGDQTVRQSPTERIAPTHRGLLATAVTKYLAPEQTLRIAQTASLVMTPNMAPN